MQLFTSHQWTALPLMMAGAMMLAGCSTAGKTAATDDQGATEVSFPDISRSTIPEGTFVNLDNLRQVEPGMTKKQLYPLLGAPQFNEGVFGVDHWNYVFDFRKADGSGDYFTCQYQVVFNKDHVAEQFYWKPASCKSVLDKPAPVAAAPAPVPLPSKPISLSADALFAFDKADLTDAGRSHLDALLQQLRSASQIEDITIAGYTDRIGTDSYNMDLSRRRAESVRDYLAAAGVPANAMRVDGRGEADPVVQCDDKERSQLIACLAPNRRVELSGQMRQEP